MGQTTSAMTLLGRIIESAALSADSGDVVDPGHRNARATTGVNPHDPLALPARAQGRRPLWTQERVETL